MEKSRPDHFIVSAFAYEDDAIIFTVEDVEKKTEFFSIFDKHLIAHYREQLTDNPLEMFNIAIAKHTYEVEVMMNGNKAIIDFNGHDDTITVICTRYQVDRATSLSINAMKHQYVKLKTQHDELKMQNQRQCEELALLRREMENVKKSVALAAATSDDCLRDAFIAELNGRGDI